MLFSACSSDCGFWQLETPNEIICCHSQGWHWSPGSVQMTPCIMHWDKHEVTADTNKDSSAHMSKQGWRKTQLHSPTPLFIVACLFLEIDGAPVCCSLIEARRFSQANDLVFSFIKHLPALKISLKVNRNSRISNAEKRWLVISLLEIS